MRLAGAPDGSQQETLDQTREREELNDLSGIDAAAGSADRAPEPSRWSRLARSRWTDRAISALIFVGLVALAQVSAERGWLSELLVPRPSDVWESLRDGFSSGLYWPAIGSTLQATLYGFTAALLVALAISAVLTGIPRLEGIFLPYIVAFQSIPKVAIAPIIVLGLGFDQAGKTAIVFVTCIFPLLINTLQGMRVRDAESLDLMRSLGASRRQLMWYIRLPGAMPYIFAGVRIGAVFALLGAIVAEFVGSRSGLGSLLLQQKALFNVGGVYAILVILTVLGLGLHFVTSYLERRIIFWSRDLAATEGGL